MHGDLAWRRSGSVDIAYTSIGIEDPGWNPARAQGIPNVLREIIKSCCIQSIVCVLIKEKYLKTLGPKIFFI
jgi:hypothetical protein